MSEKELMNEELTRIIGGAGMSAAKFQSTCATLSDAQLQSLVSSMSKPQLEQVLATVNDRTLADRLAAALKASGNESLKAIVIKPTK